MKTYSGSGGIAPAKISIITPSFEQASYLDQAIDSVLSQGYPNIEFIIIDGGSKDGSVEIIKRNAKHLAYWVSEKDRGQTHAINKGLERITGEIWCYLNSDDLLEPGCLQTVGRLFDSQPDLDWVSGSTRVFGESMDSWILIPRGCDNSLHYLTPWERPMQYVFPASVSCFMSRRVMEKIGAFDETLDYSMDMEYYTRAALVGGFKQTIVENTLGAWRWHPAAKSWNVGCAYGFRGDEIAIAERYIDLLPLADQIALAAQLKGQKKGLITRKAMWFLGQGRRRTAFIELMQGLRESLSMLWFRPWLRAMRRCLLPVKALSKS